MHVSFHLASALDQALRTAATTAGLDATLFAPDVRPADPRHGDFQANGVLGYAKSQKQNPRALAEKLVAALPPEVATSYTVAIAGPGFINFTAHPAALQAWLAAHTTREALAAGAASCSAQAGQTWIVDYSSPNTAKQMHVGHLRSAVIGEAICRLLAFSGARVIRDNHIGDWGTQFGKLIWAYKRQLDAAALKREPLEEFERLYKVGNNAADADPAVLEEARQELVKLQSGDAENLAVWKHINEVSMAAFQEIYDQLGIQFDITLGESFYNDKVEAVYQGLTDCGLAEVSQGALVVFHPEHPRFKTQPFIVRKSDGAANYASTDLATIRYRLENFHANGALYVVDKRQGDHFEQLFLTAKKWFEKNAWTLPHLEHVDFGTVLGENGKPLKTRSGDNIKLKDLLAEATERALRLVNEKSADLPEEERQAISRIVGVGSVQYADLSQNRSSDYLFSWDKMISLEGNTAAYLLYAVARIRSIFRKLDTEPGAGESAASALETPTEIALARKLVKFADAVQSATAQLRPHFLCTYLYEVAGEFSAFYNADKVAVDDPAVRARRLQLCARTLLVLETGLGLLSLRTLKRM
ncbi:MAG: arginine--tRNA ligase [Opitutaceae bacterium]|nr:arginine--tRNA ligase [Opitutaceae bacterium]MBP8962119.1 arginine--tRNA ligase [Opitutaceae bacterium]